MTFAELFDAIRQDVRNEFPVDDGYCVIWQVRDLDGMFGVGLTWNANGNVYRHACVAVQSPDARPLHDDCFDAWEVEQMWHRWEAGRADVFEAFWRVIRQRAKAR